MKRKDIQIIIILVLAFQGAFCQAPMYFSKANYAIGITANATNVLLTDSEYIIAGAYKDSININQRLYLAVIAHNGTLKSICTHGIDSLKFYPTNSGSIIQTNDTGYIWACQKANTIKSMGTLIRFDKFFNVLWEVDYRFYAGFSG